MSNSQIVKKYINLVCYIAQTRTKCEADADDVCRKVFLEYVKQRPDFDSGETAKAWFVKATLDTVSKLYESNENVDIEQNEYSSEFDELIPDESLVSNELKVEILAAMSEQNENDDLRDSEDDENIEADTSVIKKVKSANSAEKIVMRVVAVVAVIVLIVTLTPLRGCVADSIREATLGNMKKSSKGCTVEIVEARAANDFLYLTINESYSKGSISKDDKTGQYILPDIYYSGSINSSDGDYLEFDSSHFLYLQYANDDYGDHSFNYKDRTIGIDDDWYKKHRNFTINAKYKIYIPDLMSFVGENDDNYTCSLNASSEKTKSNIKFKFALDDIDDVVNSKSYYLNHWVDVDELIFSFHRLQISPSVLDLIIEWDPPVNEDYDPDSWAELELSKKDDKSETITLKTYLEEELITDANQTVFPTYLKFDNKCYMILSDYNSEYDFSDSDVKIEIKDLHCNYDRLIENYHDLNDIVLKSKKVNEKEYKLNTKIEIGDIQIKLNSINVLQPEDNYTNSYFDYTYSHLGFNGTLKYTGKDKLAFWKGYMDLINPVTNETAKFCIQYHNWPGEYGSGFHVPSGFKVQSYQMEDHYKFLRELSQWHIASVTEVFSVTYHDDDILNEQEAYQNRWVNQKFADVKANTLRGRKVINYSVR